MIIYNWCGLMIIETISMYYISSYQYQFTPSFPSLSLRLRHICSPADGVFVFVSCTFVSLLLLRETTSLLLHEVRYPAWTEYPSNDTIYIYILWPKLLRRIYSGWVLVEYVRWIKIEMFSFRPRQEYVKYISVCTGN